MGFEERHNTNELELVSRRNHAVGEKMFSENNTGKHGGNSEIGILAYGNFLSFETTNGHEDLWIYCGGCAGKVFEGSRSSIRSTLRGERYDVH